MRHPMNQPLKINLQLMLSAKVIHWFSYKIGVGEIWERVECMTVTHWHRHAGLQTMSESMGTYNIRARVGTGTYSGLRSETHTTEMLTALLFCSNPELETMTGVADKAVPVTKNQIVSNILFKYRNGKR